MNAMNNVSEVGKAGRRWTLVLNTIGPLIGLFFAWLLFATLRPSTFATWENTKIMLLQTTVVGVAALGATLIIISGGIDLSVGSVIALCTVTTALFLSTTWKSGPLIETMPVLWPAVAALGTILVAMLCGAAVGTMVIGHVGRLAAILLGLVSGIWAWRWGWFASLGVAGCVIAAVLAVNELAIKRIRLVPFIVTLGTLGAVRGLAEGLADQQMVLAPASWLNNLLLMTAVPPGVPVMIVLALLTAGILRYTRFGRYVFAIGSNERTARLCGIPVERVKLLVYTLAVAFAGVAGLLQFSYLRMGDPTTAPGYELNVIAAVVIGGGSLAGGQGSVLGSLIGALIMTVVANGCNKVGLDPWVQKIVTGTIIVTAVALDRLRHRRSSES